MADLSKTIQIIFEGVDNTPKALESIGKGIEGFAGSVENATQPLANITQGILALDTAMAALGAAMLKVVVDAAGAFEQSFTEINTIIGLPADKLAAFKDDIFEYAQGSTQSFEQINAAIYNAVSAGVAYEDALTALAEAEKLAVGGNASLEESLKLLVSTTNAYGPSLYDAGEAADIFFKTVEVGATTVPELNASLGQIVPVAAALGVPLEEIGAALATATASGIGTSEAATGLKAALSNIISPSKQAAEAAAAMGVEFNASALESNGLVGLLNKLVDATGGNAEKMKELFGSTEAYTLVMSLTNEQGEKLNENLGKIKDSTGAAAAAYDAMSGTLENVNQKLSNSIDAVLIRMGDEVLDEYKGLLNSFAGLFGNLAGSIDDGALDAPLGIIESFLNDFSSLVNEIAAALPEALGKLDWSDFEESMAGLKESFGGLFDGLDLTTPEGLAQVIQGLIDTGSGLINVTSGIIDGLKPLFAIIGEGVSWFSELDPEVQKAIGYFLGLATSVNTVAGFVGSLGAAISGGAGLIKAFGTLGDVIGKLNPIVQALGVFFAAYEFGKWAGEVTGFNDAWDKLADKIIESNAAVELSAKALTTQDEKLAAVAKTLGVGSLSMEEFNQAVADGAIKFDDATGTWKEAEQVFDDWGTTLGLASDSAIALAEGMLKSGELSQAAFDAFMAGDKSLESLWATMDATATKTGELGTAVKDVTSTAAYWGDAIDAVKEKYDQGLLTQEEYALAVKAIDDAAKGAGVELVTMADQQDKAAKSSKEMAEASEKFALEWEKLLSAERIAIFEASADIQVAQIEADAERAKAAMEMLSESFQSTGEVLTELIGLWAGLEGLDQQQITEWIEREYAIREQLAQAQIDLVQAEIARMEAQTRLLERGGVELTIQSDGLEPDLEAFMFKIIDRVRVAVAGSYEEFLLGCGA